MSGYAITPEDRERLDDQHVGRAKFLIAVIERAIEEEKVSVQALRLNLSHVRGLLGKHATATSEEP